MQTRHSAPLFVAAVLAAVLLGSSSGCEDVARENKDLQMDRRQVDTYADETPVPSADEAATESAGSD